MYYFNVSCEFDKFRVDTHLCKLRDTFVCALAGFHGYVVAYLLCGSKVQGFSRVMLPDPPNVPGDSQNLAVRVGPGQEVSEISRDGSDRVKKFFQSRGSRRVTLTPPDP